MDNAWQEVFDRFTYGIYLVSVRSGGSDNAMIASWVTQCSHEPAMFAVAIRHNRLTHSQIRENRAFSIAVLYKMPEEYLRRFKITDWQNKFDGIETFRSEAGFLIPKEVIGYLDCSLSDMIAAGDHTLFIGRVTSGKMLNGIEPMTTKDYEGCYRGNR